MASPGQGENGVPNQYYNWNNQGPDMSKYAAPTDQNQPPPYGFSSPVQPPPYTTQQEAYPPQQGVYPPQQGVYPPQQGVYPPQQGVYLPQQVGALPLPVASARSRELFKRVMCIRISIAVVSIVVIVAVGVTTGYYN